MRILGIIIVLVLASLGLSWVIGSQTGKILDNYALYVDQQPGYEASVTDFEQGLFHSTATLEIKPDLDLMMSDIPQEDRQELLSALGGLAEGVSIQLDIDQGPLIFRNGFYAGLYRVDFNIDPESMIVRQYVPGHIDINDYLNTEWRMGYFGKGMIELDFPAFSHRMGEVTLSTGGADINMGLTGYGRGFDLEGTLYPLTMSSPDGEELVIDGITMEGKGVMATAEKPINDTEMKISLPSIIGNGAQYVRFNNAEIEFKVDTDEDEGTFDASYGMSTGEIIIPELDVPINNMALTFTGENLSIEGFTRFYQAYTQSVEMMQQDPFGAQNMLLDGMNDMLEGNPVFGIEEFVIDMGNDIHLDLSADVALADGFSVSMLQLNPMLALGSLQMNMDLEMSQAFMEMAIGMYIDNALAGLEGMDQAFIDQMRQQQMSQIGAMSQQFVMAGYLTQEGDNYLMSLSMNGGQILINGTPLPLQFGN